VDSGDALDVLDGDDAVAPSYAYAIAFDGCGAIMPVEMLRDVQMREALRVLRWELELNGGVALRALEKVERLVGVAPIDVVATMTMEAAALPDEAKTIDAALWKSLESKAPPHILPIHVRRSIVGEIPGVFVVWYHTAPVAGKSVGGFFAAVINIEGDSSRPLGRYMWKGRWTPEDE
jgi:hypothetical protein